MDDYTSIKDGFEAMNDGTLLAFKDKLEAPAFDEIGRDAVPAKWKVVEMCHAVIAERTMATMRQKVAAVVNGRSLSVKGILLKYLTLGMRLYIVTSIIEDSCRALLRPDYETFTMMFEELADAKECESERRFETTGRSPFYSFYGIEHCVCIKTSPAGTTFTVNSRELCYPVPDSPTS